MKYILLFCLLLTGCISVKIKDARSAQYKVGDCIDMHAMTITDKGEWDSSGHQLGAFKILEIIHTDKMNTYMAERFHAHDFYKIKILPGFGEDKAYYKNTTFVIPIEDLDSYRYAGVFWQLPDQNTYHCNEYPQENK